MSIDVMVGMGGLIFGIFSWITSGVLKDKGKIIEHDVRLTNVEKWIDVFEKRINGTHEK